MNNRAANLGAVLESMGVNFGPIAKTFNLIEVVEEEIERARRLYPGKDDLLWNAFLACNTPIIPDAAPVSVFRVHYRQFLRNLAEGIGPDQPTLIEVGVMVGLGSIYTAPPQYELGALFLSDEETMGAYDMEPLPAPGKIGQEYWPELTRMCVKVWESVRGESRANVLKKSLAKNRSARPLADESPTRDSREVKELLHGLQYTFAGLS